jgi:hypothetical protein
LEAALYQARQTTLNLTRRAERAITFAPIIDMAALEAEISLAA